jgi:hypothetical protein
MKTPREIYDAYKILPNLQLHQLRVTAVAKLVCDGFKAPVDERTVILACLFHDMGNILKFDLMRFPEFVAEKGVGYWQEVKNEYAEKYGRDQHEATLKIARELGLSEQVRICIDSIAFSKAEATLGSGTWEQKICEYADSRVGPHGVLPLDERLREARKRYLTRTVKPDIALVPPDRFEEIVQAEHELERVILAQATHAAEDINDAAVATLLGKLWEYPVS